MAKKRFSEHSPLAYSIAVFGLQQKRHIADALSGLKFAKTKQEELLPCLVYKHSSLIRRQLGEVDMQLQNNKAVNLGLAAPQVNSTLINFGETFSFWQLVGNPSEKKGYKTGLTIRSGAPSKDIGGGMCQFTNLLHWLILHSPLDIIEYHHHDGFDLFPDFNRQVPFGCGTSIFYNYLDYRFQNVTKQPYQLVVYTTSTHLCGQLRTSKPVLQSFHIKAEDEHFTKEDSCVYRNNKIYRTMIDKHTGTVISKDLIKTNHARVMYSTDNIAIKEDFDGK